MKNVLSRSFQFVLKSLFGFFLFSYVNLALANFHSIPENGPLASQLLSQSTIMMHPYDRYNDNDWDHHYDEGDSWRNNYPEDNDDRYPRHPRGFRLTCRSALINYRGDVLRYFYGESRYARTRWEARREACDNAIRECEYGKRRFDRWPPRYLSSANTDFIFPPRDPRDRNPRRDPRYPENPRHPDHPGNSLRCVISGVR